MGGGGEGRGDWKEGDGGGVQKVCLLGGGGVKSCFGEENAKFEDEIISLKGVVIQ